MNENVKRVLKAAQCNDGQIAAELLVKIVAEKCAFLVSEYSEESSDLIKEYFGLM